VVYNNWHSSFDCSFIFTFLLYVYDLVTNISCKYAVWLLYAEDVTGACAAAVTIDCDNDGEYWGNVIPDDAPSLLASCRRLSRSCGQLAVNNTTSQFLFSPFVALLFIECYFWV